MEVDGKDTTIKDDDTRVIPLSAMPSAAQGNLPVDEAALGEVDEEGAPTMRAEAERHLQSYNTAATFQKERDAIKERGIACSDDLSLAHFFDTDTALPLCSHAIYIASNYDQPPLTGNRAPYVRLLATATSKKQALRLKSAFAKDPDVIGVPRITRTAQWLPIMRTAEEQEDAELVAAHTEAVLARMRWYRAAHVKLMELVEARKLTTKKVGGLFEVMEPPLLDRVPTGVLKEGDILNKDQVPLPKGEDTVAKTRAAMLDSGSEEEEEEEGKGAEAPPSLSTVPDRVFSVGKEGSFMLASVLPDVTLHEHLWLSYVNTRVAELFGEGTLPPIPKARLFEDDVPRPLVRVYPLLAPPHVGKEDMEACRSVMNDLVEDVEVCDFPLGSWLTPQRLDNRGSNRVFRTELQNQLWGEARERRRVMAAQYRAKCDELGVDSAAMPLGDGSAAVMQLQGLREKMSDWKGVEGQLPKGMRRKVRRMQKKGRIPLPEPRTKAGRDAFRDPVTRTMKKTGLLAHVV